MSVSTTPGGHGSPHGRAHAEPDPSSTGAYYYTANLCSMLTKSAQHEPKSHRQPTKWPKSVALNEWSRMQPPTEEWRKSDSTLLL